MNIFSDFAVPRIGSLFEASCLGLSGGLYGDNIKEPAEGMAGIITKEDIASFVRFQHASSDYHSDYSTRDDKELQNNPDKLAEEFLKIIDTDFWGKVHYCSAFPEALENFRTSLENIARET